MNKPRFQPSEVVSQIFGLTKSSVKYRNTWRIYVAIAVYFTFSLITLMLSGDQLLTTNQRFVLIGMSGLKYLPLLWAIYNTAKTKAAEYLDDIYEIQDHETSLKFIEEMAFGTGYKKDEGVITIDEGKISKEDEISPIILIGGPGKVKVNLGSAALLEQVDGDPKVIYARDEAWQLDCFERIREIGNEDQVGKREYAVINLQEQFVGGILVRSRTKDGIPLEAQDIKIRFSVLRNANPKDKTADDFDPYSFDERAVQSLVYNQTIMTPPPQTVPGISFPWDTTVIPLVIYKLDKIITEHTLSEILASISQQELDALAENEQTIKKMQVDLTGETKVSNSANAMSVPKFKQRSKITQDFYENPFTEEAAELGVVIHWIDIGTWQFPENIKPIKEKLKGAWDLTRANVAFRNKVDGSRKAFELDEFLQLINATIVSIYDKNFYSPKPSDKDFDEIVKLSEKTTGIKPDYFLRQEQKPINVGARKSLNTAREMLQAFRKELLSAKEHIEKESRTHFETQVTIAKIDKAVHDIETIIFHTLKK